MASLRDIRRKIRAVQNIQQITQAMKMIAAQRLKRVQTRVTAAKPYAEKMQQLVGCLAPQAQELHHPLLEVREPTKSDGSVGAIGVVVISGDKGLCGSYNNNVIRCGAHLIEELQQECPVKVLTVGRKATDYFRRRNYDLHASFPQIGVDAPYAQVKQIAEAITGIFLEGVVDRVHIAYTEFVTTIQQRAHAVEFLPIAPPAATGDDQSTRNVDYLFEPPAPELFGVLLPRYVESRIHHLLLESVASEFGARMTAMSNATENAGELIDTLTLNYNKARQATITKELLEVVSGAEALRAGG